VLKADLPQNGCAASSCNDNDCCVDKGTCGKQFDCGSGSVQKASPKRCAASICDSNDCCENCTDLNCTACNAGANKCSACSDGYYLDDENKRCVLAADQHQDESSDTGANKKQGKRSDDVCSPYNAYLDSTYCICYDGYEYGDDDEFSQQFIGAYGYECVLSIECSEPRDCNDSNECTENQCNVNDLGIRSCEFSSLADSTPCSIGTCKNGICDQCTGKTIDDCVLEYGCVYEGDRLPGFCMTLQEKKFDDIDTGGVTGVDKQIDIDELAQYLQTTLGFPDLATGLVYARMLMEYLDVDDNDTLSFAEASGSIAQVIGMNKLFCTVANFKPDVCADDDKKTSYTFLKFGLQGIADKPITFFTNQGKTDEEAAHTKKVLYDLITAIEAKPSNEQATKQDFLKFQLEVFFENLHTCEFKKEDSTCDSAFDNECQISTCVSHQCGYVPLNEDGNCSTGACSGGVCQEISCTIEEDCGHSDCSTILCSSGVCVFSNDKDNDTDCSFENNTGNTEDGLCRNRFCISKAQRDFRLNDENRDDELDKTELAAYMANKLGYVCPPAQCLLALQDEVSMVMPYLDTDASGTLSFAEADVAISNVLSVEAFFDAVALDDAEVSYFTMEYAMKSVKSQAAQEAQAEAEALDKALEDLKKLADKNNGRITKSKWVQFNLNLFMAQQEAETGRQ